MTVPFKICGLTDPAAVDAVADAGAQFAGFVFFPPSPRSVSLDDAAMLTARTPDRIQRVGLFVDPDDDTLTRTLAAAALDIIQLHGKETPDRVAEVRARTGRPVIKALGITDAADLDAAARFAPVVDYFMFDAKPPKEATRPGGNAVRLRLDIDGRSALGQTLVPGRWADPGQRRRARCG